MISNKQDDCSFGDDCLVLLFSGLSITLTFRDLWHANATPADKNLIF